MISPTYGEVNMQKVAKLIQNYILDNKNKSNGFNVIVGTDSQNFDKTKVVVVIAVQNIGHGGIFFYDITRIDRINNIKQKLIVETQTSLEYATKLINEFESLFDLENFDYTTELNFSIHVDAGYNGPTKQVIPEIVAWVRSYGFDVAVKPDSFVSSSIADKYSK